jgi:hypothetical protein
LPDNPIQIDFGRDQFPVPAFRVTGNPSRPLKALGIIGAQRTIQSFSSSQPESHPKVTFHFFPDYLARFKLGHTVKELVSRGLKSRSGVSAAIDIPSLGRHPSWRPAKLRAPPGAGQYLFASIFDFSAARGSP